MIETTTFELFDREAHDAEVRRLAGEAEERREAARLAAEARDDAEAEVELLDILSDTDSKINKTRLAHERAEARYKAAEAARKVAERKLEQHPGWALAEALRPMAEKLTGGHPRIPIYAVAGEVDLTRVEAPALVISQRGRTEYDGGKLTSSVNRKYDKGNAVVLQYVYDRGFHADLLTKEAVLEAAMASRVVLSPTLHEPMGWAYPHQFRGVTNGDLESGLSVSEVSLWPSTFEQVPVVAQVSVEILPKSILNAVNARADQMGTSALMGEVRVNVRGDKITNGIREVELEVTQALAEPNGVVPLPHLLYGALAKWQGEVLSTVGRVVSVRPGPMSGAEALVYLTAVSKAV